MHIKKQKETCWINIRPDELCNTELYIAELLRNQTRHCWITKGYVILCAIWYHLHNLKNVKNIHERVLLLVKLQALACYFTKSITLPWMFFTFFKLYKWYRIAQSVSYMLTTDKRYIKVALISCEQPCHNNLENILHDITA